MPERNLKKTVDATTHKTKNYIILVLGNAYFSSINFERWDRDLSISVTRRHLQVAVNCSVQLHFLQEQSVLILYNLYRTFLTFLHL